MRHELRLIPYHPFTQAQASTLEAIANGLTLKKAAKLQGKSVHTVKHHVYGDFSPYDKSKCSSDLGIVGVFRQITSQDLKLQGIICQLLGDVLY